MIEKNTVNNVCDWKVMTSLMYLKKSTACVESQHKEQSKLIIFAMVVNILNNKKMHEHATGCVFWG